MRWALLVIVLAPCIAVARPHKAQLRARPSQPVALPEVRPEPRLSLAPATTPTPAYLPENTTTVTVTQTRRWGLFGGGVALFMVGWAADMGLSYGVSHPQAYHSIIPLVGPLIQMGNAWGLRAQPQSTGNPQLDAMVNTQVTEVNTQLQTSATVILVIDFALQLTGVVMAITGVASKQQRLRYARTLPTGTATALEIKPVAGGTTLALRF